MIRTELNSSTGARILPRFIAAGVGSALLVAAICPIANADTGLTGIVTSETPLFSAPAIVAPVSSVPAGTPVAIVCLTTNDPDPTTGPLGPVDDSRARWRITYDDRTGYVDTAAVLINGAPNPAETVRYSC